MDWISISVIICLSLFIYFTVRVDGFQDKQPEPPPVFLTLETIKALESYCFRTLEENKDYIDHSMSTKLQNYIKRFRYIINTHEGDDNSISYKFTMLESHKLHLLIEDINNS